MLRNMTQKFRNNKSCKFNNIAYQLPRRALGPLVMTLVLPTRCESSCSDSSSHYRPIRSGFQNLVLFHKVMAHFRLKFNFYFSLNLKSNSNNFLFFFKRVQFFSYPNLYIWLRVDTYLNLKSNHYEEILRNQKLGSYI